MAGESGASTEADEGRAAAIATGLASLARKSLLRRELGADGAGTGEEEATRYGMLATIREYGEERLEASGEAGRVRGAHAEYFLTLAERAAPELTGPEQVRWLDRLETEHDNLRAALEWLSRADEEQTTAAELRLVAALWRFWDIRGYLTEGRQRLERAVQIGRDAGVLLQVYLTVLDGAGVLSEQQGDLDRAKALYEDEQAIADEVGDKYASARAMYNLGVVAETRGDYGRATNLYEQALALQREMGSDRAIAAVLEPVVDSGVR